MKVRTAGAAGRGAVVLRALVLRAAVLGAVVLGAVVLGASTAVHAEKQHVADYFEVVGDVRPDGSLDVEESITCRFIDGDYTFVNRVIPAAFTDGVEILGAAMDGRELPWGDEEGQFEVDYRTSRVRLRWSFAPTRDTTHVFTLRYRLKGVVRKGDGEDWLAWAPFPADFDYPIVSGRAFLRWQPGMHLRRQAHVQGPITVSAPVDDGIALDVSGYEKGDEDVVITARFAAGAFLGAEPQWQRDEARASQMGPAFIAGACMIIAATILALLIFFLKYRRERPDPLSAGHEISELPEALLPALAGTIVHGRVQVSGVHALSTVFDLAGRGVITIAEQPASGLIKSPKFTVKAGRELPLAPHEQTVRDVLFAADDRRLDKALRSLASRPGAFKKAVKEELKALGYLDTDRVDAAKGMVIAGVCVLTFAIAIFFVILATNFRLGKASLLIPAAFFVSAVTMMIVGGSFSTLSTRGWRAAARWKAYRRHLKSQAREGKLPSSAETVSRLLPYATALGVAPSWLKALKRTPGAAVPPWLATLGPSGTNAAFVALLASSTSSASHGGGAGSSGAAGGGSSSAG